MNYSFRRGSNGSVICSAGFTIFPDGRFGLKYVTDELEVQIPIEPGRNPEFFVTVFAAHMKGFDANRAEIRLTDEHKNLIVTQVCDAFVYQQIYYEVNWNRQI